MAAAEGSSWAAVAAYALKHHMTLKEASRAYRQTNKELTGVELPGAHARSHEHRAVGELLSRGHSFSEALRMARGEEMHNPGKAKRAKRRERRHNYRLSAIFGGEQHRQDVRTVRKVYPRDYAAWRREDRDFYRSLGHNPSLNLNLDGTGRKVALAAVLAAVGISIVRHSQQQHHSVDDAMRSNLGGSPGREPMPTPAGYQVGPAATPGQVSPL